ncbi:MAG: hypothetical protein KDJ14_07310 [Xanthomonadales bacterium]|nr:hypothetical protein [Xanthomonadales bacterium]
MTFQPHGELRISVEYPLLISHARGPWNRELVVLWRKQALAHAQAMQRLGPWVGVGVMRGSMTCTLDALALHRETAEYMVAELGAVGSAHVAGPEVEGYAMMRGVFDRMFDGVCPHAHFDRLEDVRPWAEQLLDRRVQSSSDR